MLSKSEAYSSVLDFEFGLEYACNSVVKGFPKESVPIIQMAKTNSLNSLSHKYASNHDLKQMDRKQMDQWGHLGLCGIAWVSSRGWTQAARVGTQPCAIFLRALHEALQRRHTHD